MTTTLYITRTGDMIQTGKPAEVTLEEYPEISRTWIRRVTVELPAGFEAAEAGWYYSQTKRAVLVKYKNPGTDATLTVSFEDFDLIGM